MTCTDEQNVMGVVMTASPRWIPMLARAVCKAAVQELTARAAGAPMNSPKADSNWPTRGPVVIQSVPRTSRTAARSSSPIDGGEKDRKSSLLVMRAARMQSAAHSWCQG